ncbi:MAG: IS701 family transposase, partial [Thermoplasmata archaeon]
YQPKWRIGLTLIDRARALRLPHRAVVGDSGFGAPEFRRELRRRKEAYLVGVQPTGTTRVKVGEEGPPVSPEVVASGLPSDRWAAIRWAEGSKGPLQIEAARVKVTVWEGGKPTEECGWLLFERRSNETKAYLVWGLDKLSLVEQVQVMRSRFPIEQSYQQMKEELGLDHFEGRSWRGWHHHVTMVGLAQGFLMLERRKAVRRKTPKKGAKRRRLPTVPTVRRWLNGHVALGFIRLIEKHPDRRVEIGILMSQVFGAPVWVKDGQPYLPSLAEFAEGEGPP